VDYLFFVAMASHSWESPRPSRHTWEDSGDAVGGSEPDSDFEAPPASAGDEFIQAMVELLMMRVLNAGQFCSLMYLAGKAGVSAATRYGKPPGTASGHFQRHLDPLLGTVRETDALYEASVPAQGKRDLSRSTHQFTMFAPHELLAADMEQTGFRTRLAEFLDVDRMPPAYWQHSIVSSNPFSRVVPLALFIDGVPYSITDSVIGFWLICVATGKRYLFATLRKRLLCKCGCRGWCTLRAIFMVIVWSLTALAQGVFPTRRHDGEWKPSDDARARKGGQVMPYKAAVIYLKGDWCEFSTTLGFPSWNDGLRPCYECACCGPEMYCAYGHTIEALSWPLNGDQDYELACRRCEVTVTLNAADREFVCERLKYDKRQAGSRGRALTQSIPHLGLEADDRLEPSDTLADVGALEEAAVPIDVVFWRVSNESLARHRNPLFCAVLGMTPRRSLAVDELHALNLGVLNDFARMALWFLISSNIFGNVGAAEENMQVAVLALRHELHRWYKEVKGRYPGLTEVSDLTVKMLGSSSHQKLKTKGAETWGVVLFLVDMLERHAGMVGETGARYLQAGMALRRMVQCWRACGNIVPEADQQDHTGETSPQLTTQSTDCFYTT
jgi:hypothetical protein